MQSVELTIKGTAGEPIKLTFTIVAAVALVDVEERSIDVLFVNRDDRRRVEGVMPFRAPSQRFSVPAVFTD